MVLKEKTMSNKLSGLIKNAAVSLLNFGLLWIEIKEVGAKEGFSEKELEQKTRKELWQLPDMTRGKMYYFFHRDQKREQSKSDYQNKVSKRRNIPTLDAKNGNAKYGRSDLPTDQQEGRSDCGQHDEESITETKIKFDPKHFQPNNLYYYDIDYLKEALLYYYNEFQRLKKK
jgi:hypothetical protein